MSPKYTTKVMNIPYVCYFEESFKYSLRQCIDKTGKINKIQAVVVLKLKYKKIYY